MVVLWLCTLLQQAHLWYAYAVKCSIATIRGILTFLSHAIPCKWKPCLLYSTKSRNRTGGRANGANTIVRAVACSKFRKLWQYKVSILVDEQMSQLWYMQVYRALWSTYPYSANTRCMTLCVCAVYASRPVPRPIPRISICVHMYCIQRKAQ